MDNSRIHQGGNVGRSASLTACLERVLRDAGGQPLSESIHAVLGLSLRMVASRSSACAANWPTLGCDHFLLKTCRLFGMRIRELHPPAAASGLRHYEAFDQHFRISYAPLIRAALHHDQVVLAWRGWAGARTDIWGIITEASHDGEFGFLGRTAESASLVVPLERPPVQVYVIESNRPCRPEARELVEAATLATQAWWSEDVQTEMDLTTGVAAYRLWQCAVEKCSCPDHQSDAFVCAAALAGDLYRDRLSAARFYEFIGDEMGEQKGGPISSVVASCQRAAYACSEIQSLASDVSIRNTASDRAALVHRIQMAVEADQAAVSAILAVGRTDGKAH